MGPCPPRCCLEVWPLSAMKRVQAQAALKTDTPSDGRSFVQREPSGASEIQSDFGPSLSLREGETPCSPRPGWGHTRPLPGSPAPQAHTRRDPPTSVS